MAHCPAHDDRVPSLAIRETDDGRMLVRCHAGCSQHAVIDALIARHLWPGVSGRPLAPVPVPPQISTVREPPRDRTRLKAAMAIWHQSEPAAGTLVETYLRARGITLPPPRVLTFQPRLRHLTGGVWQGMVALVTRGRDDDAVGIHRTFLTRDGGAKATVSPQNDDAWPLWRWGGAVSRGHGCCAGRGGSRNLPSRHAGDRASGVGCALSAAGLRSLDLPEHICTVVVLADADPSGEAAALAAGRRWRRQGRDVRIARPPTGLDFNDMLLGRTAEHEEGPA